MTVRIRGKPRDVIFISSIKSLRLSKNLLLQFTATGNVAYMFSTGSTHVAGDAVSMRAVPSRRCSKVAALATRFRVPRNVWLP